MPFLDLKKKREGTGRFSNLLGMTIKLSFVFILMAINFIALSVSLNCNIDKPVGTRLISAIFAFFFGILYLFVNYYGYRVTVLNKPCVFDKDTLFPFPKL